LLKYCWLDTYAMYAIYKKLLLIIEKSWAPFNQKVFI
jgi:hypothetical protein